MSSDSTNPNNRPQSGTSPPIKRPPKPSGRTLEEWITSFERADGTQGLRVRELTGALHIAAETLQVAKNQPERLSLASIFDLADLLGIAPDQLIADIFHQVSIRNDVGLIQARRRQVRQRRKH